MLDRAAQEIAAQSGNTVLKPIPDVYRGIRD
jgi:hypothetical protein